MSRPSSSSSTSPPSRLISAARAASRSVSWPRRWATPVRRDSPSARAATAATTGVSSPTSCRSSSTPLQRRAGGEDQVVAVALRVPAERLGDATPGVAGLRGRLGPAEDAHRPAGDQGGGHERTGVGQVGLDVRVERRDRAGLRRPSGRVVGRRRPRRAGAARRPSCRCAAATAAGAPVCCRSSPRSKRGAASSSADTNWLDADASISSDPPSTWPVPCTVNGRAERPPSSISTPSARSAVIDGRHRTNPGPLVAVERDGRAGERGERRDEPHDGAGEPAVDGDVTLHATRPTGVIVQAEPSRSTRRRATTARRP